MLFLASPECGLSTEKDNNNAEIKIMRLGMQSFCRAIEALLFRTGSVQFRQNQIMQRVWIRS